MNCENSDCPFWDNGVRFSCAKVSNTCLQVKYPQIDNKVVNVTFVGDSLSMQHYNSFSCMLWSQCKKKVSFTRHIAGLKQECRMLCGSQVCMQNAGTRYEGQRPTANYVRAFAQLPDIQVYNEGLWWNTFELAFEKFQAFIHQFSNLSSDAKHRVIWRETSPQHFKSGAWTQWYKREACEAVHIRTNPWQDQQDLARRHGCKVLEVYDLSVMAWNDHLARKTNHTRARGMDCTHFCEPGVIDAWSSRLWNML